jgi:hypothetical protein
VGRDLRPGWQLAENLEIRGSVALLTGGARHRSGYLPVSARPRRLRRPIDHGAKATRSQNPGHEDPLMADFEVV